jgi:hypothetical protein
VLCREVLFHLSFRDIARLIASVRASGARYLLATTNESIRTNYDIHSGEFREVNMARRPIRLGPALQSIPDDKVVPGRVLAVWRL